MAQSSSTCAVGGRGGQPQAASTGVGDAAAALVGSLDAVERVGGRPGGSAWPPRRGATATGRPAPALVGAGVSGSAASRAAGATPMPPRRRPTTSVGRDEAEQRADRIGPPQRVQGQFDGADVATDHRAPPIGGRPARVARWPGGEVGELGRDRAQQGQPVGQTPSSSRSAGLVEVGATGGPMGATAGGHGDLLIGWPPGRLRLRRSLGGSRARTPSWPGGVTGERGQRPSQGS